MSQESKTAVIYARYSSDKQNEQSIEGQISVIESYAEKEGYEIIDSYIDRAMTGRNDDRPSFQKMIEDSKKHLFQYVIVYKLDRFSRNRYDSAVYKMALKNNGVKVISATENIGDNPESVILESMLEGYSEYYSRELAQKVRRGNRESRKKGLYTGGSIPYGYRVVDKKYVIVDTEAKIVKEIYDKSISGMKMIDIAADLNTRCITYKDGDGWDINKIKRILTNEKYKGIARFGDEVYDNIVPAIVSESVFDKVRILCNRRRHECRIGDPANEYILSGKLYCMKCGSPITGKSGKKIKGKDPYRYYVCNGKKECGCTLTNTRKQELEEEVASIAFNFVHNSDVDDLSKTMTSFYDVDETKGEISILKSQIDEIDKKLNNMIKSIQNGFYCAAMNKSVENLEDEKIKLEEKIKTLRPKENIGVTYDDCKRFLEGVKNAECAFSKESIIKYLVKAVYIDDENIKVVIYPSDDPIVRSRKDSFEIANANRTQVDTEKSPYSVGFGGTTPSADAPPNVNRTIIYNL